jgi:hypothetical protein
MAEAQAKEQAKSVPEVVADLWQLCKDYAKQETIDPLKGLGRYLKWGVPGAIMVALGSTMLAMAGLRALQTETGDAFDGNLTFFPYLITLAGAVVLAIIAISRVGRSRGAEA